MTPELEIMLRPHMSTHATHPILSGDPIGTGIAFLILLSLVFIYFYRRGK